MSHDLCKNRRPAVLLLSLDLDDALREVLRRRHLARHPRKGSALIPWVWMLNGLLALVLSFLLGFCMGESKGAAHRGTAPALRGPAPATQRASDLSPMGYPRPSSQ